MTKISKKSGGKSAVAKKPLGERLSRIEADMIKKFLGRPSGDLLELDEIIGTSVPVSDLPALARRPGRTRYQLEVSFPLDFETFEQQTEEVEQLVGEGCTSSGAGFGKRDLAFEDKTKAWCKAAAARVRAAKPEYEIRISEMAW